MSASPPAADAAAPHAPAEIAESPRDAKASGPSTGLALPESAVQQCRLHMVLRFPAWTRLLGEDAGMGEWSGLHAWYSADGTFWPWGRVFRESQDRCPSILRSRHGVHGSRQSDGIWLEVLIRGVLETSPAVAALLVLIVGLMATRESKAQTAAKVVVSVCTLARESIYVIYGAEQAL
ncbi:hypothetical protein EHS25_001234 [Saitozyma podzolica]|uniref:Uncharacterized protein n=1 Tax=Saitozyma podzolica TaxID=1890683 RepID=A0A427YHK4_9TREE|nr:hypothetical protein EHS25_001234 [Saitozyma podzolica]